MDESISSGGTIIDSTGVGVVDGETPNLISRVDMKGRDADFYSFITDIIKLGRKIEMDDVEFTSNEGGISAKFKRMRIE